jgi:hypothetical protein
VLRCGHHYLQELGAVTTFPFPLPSRRFAGWAGRARTVASSLLRPVKPVVRNLAKIPFTVAAIGILDGNVISWNTHIGLLITAASLVLLEHLIADES